MVHGLPPVPRPVRCEEPLQGDELGATAEVTRAVRRGRGQKGDRRARLGSVVPITVEHCRAHEAAG